VFSEAAQSPLLNFTIENDDSNLKQKTQKKTCLVDNFESGLAKDYKKKLAYPNLIVC